MTPHVHFDLDAIAATLDRDSANTFARAHELATTAEDHRAAALQERFWPAQRAFYLQMIAAENDGASREDIGYALGVVLGAMAATFLTSSGRAEQEAFSERFTETVDGLLSGDGTPNSVHGSSVVKPMPGGHA